MPTGKQGAPTGLAKQFADYLRERMAQKNWTIQYVADATGMSKNYIATRLREEAIFNLRDFQRVAEMLGLEPDELMVRVRFPAAATYDGKLVPKYGKTVDQSGEKFYRTEDADPPLRSNVITGPFGVAPSEQDELPAVARPTDPEPTDEQ